MLQLKMVPLCLTITALMAGGCDRSGSAKETTSDSRQITARDFSEVTCSVVFSGERLDDRIRETSGVAAGRAEPGRLWTHNDRGNSPQLFALDLAGRLLAALPVHDTEAIDWEDMESAPCDRGSCLYIGDIGDNDAVRETVAVHVIPEPDARAPNAGPAVTLRARYPRAARDAESLFVMPDGTLYVITKGRDGPIQLFRYPLPERPDSIVTLEAVREIFPMPSTDRDRVTSASATPDGRWVAVRTYRALFIYPAPAFVAGEPADPAVVDLTPLGETQGEGVAIEPDGTVWLTSEAENDAVAPTLSRLQCALPPEPASPPA